jgi:hypothetical protein
MSYNPVRARNFHKPDSRPRRKQEVGGGTRHTDIARREGIQTPLDTTGPKTQLVHGTSQEVFSGEYFDVRYELVYGGAASQFGSSEEGERCIKVLSGHLYVTTEDSSGFRVGKTLQKGASISFAKGVKYSYATSTSECELYIIESKQYKWSQLEPGITNPSIKQAPIRALPPERNTDPVRQQALKKAQDVAAKRKGRPPKTKKPLATEVATQVIGVNLAPMGPGAFDSDD